MARAKPDASRVIPLEAARRERASGAEDLSAAYTRMREPLRAFLHRRTGDAAAAEDLVQELWLRVADRSGAPAPALEKPEAYLQRAAANLAVDWLRRRRFQTGIFTAGIDAAGVADAGPGADQQLAGRQKLEALRLLIEGLPPKRRQAFLLYRGQGLSLKEAAARLGIAPQTVRLQAAKALADLRQALTDAGLWP